MLLPRRLPLVLLMLLALAQPAFACRLALALTIDVSGSIDPGEYRFQMDGLADALEDPDIAEALVMAQAAVLVMQWSGERDQEVSIPWRRMLTFEAVAGLAREVRATKRRWQSGKTAVGDALAFLGPEFSKVADCTRRVIDVSGDGMTNDGRATQDGRSIVRALGITVNGLAIDRMGKSVAQFYRREMVTGPNHFVMSAQGYSDYPRAIRNKLYREVVVPSS